MGIEGICPNDGFWTNTSCNDCLGNPNGGAVFDDCGNCNGTGLDENGNKCNANVTTGAAGAVGAAVAVYKLRKPAPPADDAGLGEEDPSLLMEENPIFKEQGGMMDNPLFNDDVDAATDVAVQAGASGGGGGGGGGNADVTGEDLFGDDAGAQYEENPLFAPS